MCPPIRGNCSDRFPGPLLRGSTVDEISDEEETMIEREAKFELDLDRPVPRLDGVGGVARQDGPVKSVLETTYYDTHGYRLIRSHVTLRRRTGGHDEGWQVKLPRADGYRDEIAAPLGQPSEPPPPSLTDRVHDLVGDDELVPVARVRTTRYSYALLDADDRPVATLTDDHVTAEVAVEKAGPDSWRELEIELSDDTRDDVLDTLSHAMNSLGVHAAPWPSKLSRALGDRLPSG